MRTYLQGRVRLILLGLAALLLLVAGAYSGLGVISTKLEDLRNQVDNEPARRNCTRRCHDGANGTIGAPGENGTCPLLDCTNGTDGMAGLDGTLQVLVYDENGTLIEEFNASVATLTFIMADDVTLPLITGPTGTAGANGTNGANGTSGPTGTAGRNASCAIVCHNGTNGSGGSSGANGAVNIAVNDLNGSQSEVSFNHAGSNLTVTIADNFTIVSLAGQPGANGANGANGVNGTNGANGVNGTNGANGVNGTNGSNGANGTCTAANLFATVTLTNAQMKAATFVTIVPAAAPGVVIMPLRYFCRLNYGGTNIFTSSPSLKFIPLNSGYLHGTTGFWQQNYTTFASLTAITDNQDLNNVANTGPIGSYGNTSHSVFLLGGITGNAANDNTLTVLMEYYLITY